MQKEFFVGDIVSHNAYGKNEIIDILYDKNKAVIKKEGNNIEIPFSELIEEEHIVENPTKRWVLGINHHPKSKELFKFIEKVDFKFGDFFCFKSGGDGDNGEHLMYLMDAFFEKQEQENN